MLSLPPELGRRYDTWLERKGVAVEQRPHYRKWLRFYWDCNRSPGPIGYPLKVG